MAYLDFQLLQPDAEQDLGLTQGEGFKPQLGSKKGCLGNPSLSEPSKLGVSAPESCHLCCGD